MDLEKYFYTGEYERPLDNPVTDGGYCGILRKVGCVGDSLSSGEFEVIDETGTRKYMDLFDYSWGQFFARMSGNEVLNFSKGGMTAKQYCETFAAEKGYWDKEKACFAYIVALGVNDINQIGGGKIEFGSVDDIDLENYENNKPTFVGYYAKILQKYREISPKCRLFLMTMPKVTGRGERATRLAEQHRELLYKLAEMFEFTYVLDLYEYAPEYGDDFHKKFYLNGHLNPAGYLFTAKMVASYVDYIIRHNMDDFVQIALLGDHPHDVNYKW